jgi:hypothetical protein
MNKKGDERVLSVYLYIIYIIVLFGVASGVLIFYGSSMDVRNAEAGILIDSSIDCISENGKIDSAVFSENFNLSEFCKFNLVDGSSKAKNRIPYFLKMEIFNFSSCEKKNLDYDCKKLVSESSSGDSKYFDYCGMNEKKFPQCEIKYVYLFGDDNSFLIKFYGVVDKYEQNS